MHYPAFVYICRFMFHPYNLCVIFFHFPETLHNVTGTQSYPIVNDSSSLTAFQYGIQGVFKDFGHPYDILFRIFL